MESWFKNVKIGPEWQVSSGSQGGSRVYNVGITTRMGSICIAMGKPLFLLD